ncbi:MAG TPA: Asp-tRNA(Asn)/Glu-tRNA(Gln) amidotransferase subunit GatC [Gemmatimonadales bacterium]|jgi:aspartyl-tRNA(Asn)/glutamyl-tRNA(Gln) amidotransferase subunit C|nr:Asp-tRNA(Asn)/Glu-tRNA(Gln) amidotransferase subunit GatC [Gemmatimonadales bacterium]
MSIGREDVARVARLAELAVSEEELPALVQQMERIVSFVEQLGEVHDDDSVAPFVAGPESTPLRDDVVRPAVLAHSVAEMAPEFKHGFFAVPLRSSMEENP